MRWGDPTSFRLRQALAATAKLKKAGAKVLEIGCGAGQFIRAIKKINPGWQCYGCDISESALGLARASGDGVVYELSESKKLPAADGSLDAALIFDVLEHVEEPEALVAEVRRTLKRGGVFYCFVPCEGDVLSMWNWLRNLGVGTGLTKQYAGHINYFSRRSLLDLFKKYNFAVESIRYSEHILGQLVGIAAFVAMDRAARIKKLSQLNNETYFSGSGQSAAFKVLKKTVNAAVYLESALFGRFPSPNMHVTLKKFGD